MSWKKVYVRNSKYTGWEEFQNGFFLIFVVDPQKLILKSPVPTLSILLSSLIKIKADIS